MDAATTVTHTEVINNSGDNVLPRISHATRRFPRKQPLYIISQILEISTEIKAHVDCGTQISLPFEIKAQMPLLPTI